MLIPSIDLMGGKVVQLVQGKSKALEFDRAEEWIERFAEFPLVQLIDLDAAMGNGSNAALVAQVVKRLPCQIGGGIRTVSAARNLLASGARRVILGSILVQDKNVNIEAARQFADAFGADKLVFALDSRAGKIAIDGWKTNTEIIPMQMVCALEPFCGAFLYTNIETEGSMKGIPIVPVQQLRHATQRRLIVAGGISTHEQIALLDSMDVDCVVGMAIYTGVLSLR